jgi:RHS repeat-associated protein
MLSPTLGRWLSRDPLMTTMEPELVLSHQYVSDRLRNASNAYLYCADNPLRLVDPSGLEGMVPPGLPGPTDIAPWIPPADWPPGARWSPDPQFLALYKQFMAWYERNKDTSWTAALPDCPCDIGHRVACWSPFATGISVFYASRIELRNPDPSIWYDPSEWLYDYHVGATACMRSKPVAGSAQQCCYDSRGHLITHGSGTGSADRATTGVGYLDRDGHRVLDKLPADWADELDGGAFGHFSRMYLDVRPSNNGLGCATNP